MAPETWSRKWLRSRSILLEDAEHSKRRDGGRGMGGGAGLVIKLSREPMRSHSSHPFEDRLVGPDKEPSSKSPLVYLSPSALYLRPKEGKKSDGIQTIRAMHYENQKVLDQIKEVLLISATKLSVQRNKQDSQFQVSEKDRLPEEGPTKKEDQALRIDEEKLKNGV
ncbi:hypothetical protein INR49_000414 [Caranx melampygus]|nr:hypothetical protein INR49_000414 [Caranx melampygus]